MTTPERPATGRYVLRRQIAAGGSARVFEAEDSKLGRLVALKTLASSYATVPEAIRRLEREARVAGSISHPNVCALTDFDRFSNGVPFLVYELLLGETLATRLERQRPIPVEQALRIAEQMLAGLDAAHQHGTIHRDIKPDNVFLVEIAPGFPLVKLLDFGTAQVPGLDSPDGEQLTSTGFVVGTAEYMAPEQVRGLRDFDARTDIYACGVVLYEMLSGVRPFGGDRGLVDLLHSIAHKKPPSLAEVAPRVPRAITRAVDVALATDRERRHADVASFLMALRAPHAPPMTGSTRVLTTATPAMPEGDDWDMPTRESGPPQSFAEVDIVIEGEPVTISRDPPDPDRGRDKR